MASMNVAFPKGDFREEVILQLNILYIFSGSSSFQGIWIITNQVFFNISFLRFLIAT